MSTSFESDPRVLERLLLPLLDSEKALAFLRAAVPDILAEMENEIREASRRQVQQQLERVRRVRTRVRQAQNEDDLEHISDTHLLPRLFMDARSEVWESWNHPELREALRSAQEALKNTLQILEAVEPGTVQFHRLREKARGEEKALLETRKNVLLEWLRDEEQRIRRQMQQPQIAWDVSTRLQVPLVVDGQVLDFIDAEMTVTASTPHAFLTRAFAVVVLAKDTPLVLALRRINLIRHFIPPDTILIVVTFNPEYAPVLKQHNTHVYVAEEPQP